MDHVACMAVAALEHPGASVTATGEAGSKPRRRQPSGESCASYPADAHYHGRIAVIETQSREPQFAMPDDLP
jgi:hypothetical protein